MSIKTIQFCEVGPRDGLQNVKDFVPTDIKIELVRRCLQTGERYMQITSFMNPKAVPQMRDAREVVEAILPDYPDVRFNALVPNLRGAKDAWDCGLREVVSAFSLSETHNKANINKTHEQSYAELERIRQAYPDMFLIFGIGTAFGCPWEGETNVDQLMEAVHRGIAIGVNAIEIADPIGVAYPLQVERYIHAIRAEYPDLELGVHMHDTRNMGIASTWAAIQCGATVIQGSVGGLGGCPFAPGATGNIATEDLVFLLDRSGVDSGIDYEKILDVARFAERNVNGLFGSHQLKVPQDTYPLCHCQ